MKERKLRIVPLQAKLSGIFIAANILVIIVNVFLMIGINNMSSQLDSVYQNNLKLNELNDKLDIVQESMTDYLNTKTSDSLEQYYRSEQDYSQLLDNLNYEVTDSYYDRMERSIGNMSKEYLLTTELAIEAKRGRNVEKYSSEYDKASRMYKYIRTYIETLNNEQFKSNSENYNELISAFGIFEVLSLFVMLGAIVGSTVFVVGFTRTLIDPIRKLAKNADEVANGNFDIETIEVSSRDEIGVVTGAFNKMVVSIRQYIEQIKVNMENERRMKEKELQTEATLKDAKLKYLQAQINPHFLFNTLNAGAQLAMMEDAQKTYDYIQNTAEFFRYNVRKNDMFVHLEDEIQLIDHYIYILNVRFSGDIKYEKMIETDISNVSMPSMILQPIVENSVNHGIKEMEGKGRITLRAYEEDNEIIVSIKDNGAGMSKDMIDKVLNGKLKEDEKPLPAGSHGIGMDNVIKRLRLFTEKENCIEIVSEGENMGTEVFIRLSRDEGEADV